jgi:hypothetical protein
MWHLQTIIKNHIGENNMSPTPVILAQTQKGVQLDVDGAYVGVSDQRFGCAVLDG